MKNSNFDNKDFNPSPFDDNNKDDLNEVLRENKIREEEFQENLEKLISLLTYALKHDKGVKKHKNKKLKFLEWPLVFIHIKPNTKDSKSWPETFVFCAMLKRSNKDIILSFAYDWLIEHKQFVTTMSKEEFVENYWVTNFECEMI